MAAADVSRSIEIQACAKIAAELAIATRPVKIEDALADFDEAFEHVVNVVSKKLKFIPAGEPWDDSPSTATGGRPVPVRKSQDEIKQELDNARGKSVTAGQIASAHPVKQKGVTIVGEQHGPIPPWLERNAAKAGVTRVYDNRNTATPENKRPQFVSADDQRTPFWPPKNSVTSQDIGLTK